MGKRGILSELIVPLGIVAVIATMLLPIPSILLDFLLVGNLVLAILLLVTCVYITEPLKLSVLPTLLLLATLYRLALNIATSRLILAHGDAGEVIQAFGEVVVQGNIIVGATIFLIITLVQFIVVAKGAERVAEVAARFTLDALPGKQMSIDADLRAGLIGAEEAKQKRDELQTESRFYGALDGAMKFVKGDSIAGLVIILVNALGGLLIGTMVVGIEIASAFNKYTLLTVGDGLLSQIPSLLNAIAAGIVVTKVTSGADKFLAKELISQLGQSAKVKGIVAALCGGACLIPGLPFLPFIGVGSLFAISASAQKRQPLQQSSEPIFTPKSPALLSVEVTSKLAEKLGKQLNLGEQLEHLRQKIYDDTGLILLRPPFSVGKGEGEAFSIAIRGINQRVPKGTSESVEFNDILSALESAVQKNRSRLIDDILTRRLLDNFDQESPELVSAVVPGMISVTQLTEVLRQLAAEGVTLRHFGQILQASAESVPKVGPNPRRLLEEVRRELAAAICAQYSDPDGNIKGYSIDPRLELLLIQSEREGKAFQPDLILPLINRLKSDALNKGEVLLTAAAARKLLRESLELQDLKVPVIAHEELIESVNFLELGTITVSERDEKGALLSMAA